MVECSVIAIQYCAMMIWNGLAMNRLAQALTTTQVWNYRITLQYPSFEFSLLFFFTDLNDSPKSTQCRLPVPPENGKFSCEINSTEVNEDEYSTPSGSICRIYCKRHHFVPAHLRHYAVFKCENGLWNSTMHEFCHRRHLSHKNHILNRNPINWKQWKTKYSNKCLRVFIL